MLSSALRAIIGSMTFNWKLPDWAPTVIAVSLPITWAATCMAVSQATGLTLPGMMLEPGCSAGRVTSPSPPSGPEFIHRRSLAIFITATAATLSWPDISTIVS